MTIKQRLTAVFMDILIVCELAYCMYLSSFDPDYQAIFLIKTYIPVALATLLLGKKIIRMMGPVAHREWINPFTQATAASGKK